MKEFLLEKITEAIILAILIPIITIIGKWFYHLFFCKDSDPYKIPHTDNTVIQNLINEKIIPGPLSAYTIPAIPLSGVEAQILRGYRYAYFIKRNKLGEKIRRKIAVAEHDGKVRAYIMQQPK